jgi:hypothetical protein
MTRLRATATPHVRGLRVPRPLVIVSQATRAQAHQEIVTMRISAAWITVVAIC